MDGAQVDTRVVAISGPVSPKQLPQSETVTLLDESKSRSLPVWWERPRVLQVPLRASVGVAVGVAVTRDLQWGELEGRPVTATGVHLMRRIRFSSRAGADCRCRIDIRRSGRHRRAVVVQRSKSQLVAALGFPSLHPCSVGPPGHGVHLRCRRHDEPPVVLVRSLSEYIAAALVLWHCV